MIFFFKADGTLIKSAPETVYQGSAEAGKVYVVAPLNANMLVDVYYELPNGERWGAYLLENNGTVINNEELPDGWALWSTTLESAITQYAGTLKVQFGFYQSGKADKVPLITSQGVTITIAKGVVRDLPSAPTAGVYEKIVNCISSIKQDIANLPNEYLSNTNEDKIALKNNGAVEYSENATAGTIAKRDSDGKINVADGTEDLNAVNVGQLNAALEKKVDGSSVSVTAVKNTIPQRTATGQLKTADAVSDEDAASYGQHKALRTYTDSELLKKLDRTGGTITGNLIVSGNLSVSGEASVIESTTLKVADKLIYVAKDNTSALTSPAGLITPKYDGTNDGGIVYDNSGTAYVGDIKLDSNGNVDVNNSDLQPIATRDNYSNFTNGHKVKVEVDSLQKSVKFVDGGKDDGINTLTDINLTLGDTTVQYDTTDGIQLNSTARFTTQETNHDAMIDLSIPVVGKDGITIDKAADAENIYVKVDRSKVFNIINSVGTSNFRRVPYLPKHKNTLSTDILELIYVDEGNTNDIGDIPSYVSPKFGDTRSSNAVLITSDPTRPYQAANKKYVDENIATHLVGVYTYKGSKDTYANFPATGNNVGDVWNVEDTGTKYAWNGTNWESLSANVLDSTGNSTVQAMSQKATTDELNKKVNTSDNFVKAFTIPNGVRKGTLAADVKQKLCNPDGHNYYVYDDTSEMILKYSFNEEDEIIQYKALYLVNDKAYDITMQILPSNGSWLRSQTVLNGATANPTLTGTEADLTSLKVGGTDYKIPASSGGEAVTPSTATSTATSGTFTSAEWAKLQANDNNYILFNNEIYRLANKAHSGTTGIWSYIHTGWDGTAIMDKSINVTVSTGAWTLVIGSASAGGKLYLHYIYFNNVVNTPTLIFYSTSLDKVTDKWIYDNLANKYSLTIFPTINSITVYDGIGLIRKITQTSSSPSWGAHTDLSHSGPTTISVSDATSYIIIEL